MLTIEELTAAISDVCPIDGVADLGDGQYRIDFRPEATEDQKAAALAIVDAGSTLAIAKRVVKDEISLLRTQYENQGFVWSGYQFQSDPGSREKLLGSFIAAKDGIRQSGATWRLADNSEISLTNAQMVSVGYTLFGWMDNCSRVSFTHKNAVDQLTTIESVNAYNYSIGWQ